MSEEQHPELNTSIEPIEPINEEQHPELNTSIEPIEPMSEEQHPELNTSIEPIEPINEEQHPELNTSIEPIEPMSEEPTEPMSEEQHPELNTSIEPTESINEEQHPELNITIEPTESINEEQYPELNTTIEPTDHPELTEPLNEEPPVNTTIDPILEDTPQSTIIEHTDYIEEQNIQFKIINHIENIGIDELKNTIESSHPIKPNEENILIYNENVPHDATEPIIYETPVIIFIVPYRDRAEEMRIFKAKMSFIMEDYPQGYYQIYYIQQNHEKPFNRGAMKNIGFLMVKQKYPQHYKNITLVFNDLDTTPVNKTTIRNYSTRQGIIKHFYGYDFVLGGIVSITAGDFEYLNGFPNYYAWGFEDNELNDRAKRHRITIDRSVFYPINDAVNITQIKQSSIRIVNSGEFDRFIRRVNEGLNTIYDLYFTVNETTGLVDVTRFKTTHNVNLLLNRVFHPSKSKYPFRTGYSGKKRCKMNLVF
jgi:hypothetical protein